MAGGLRREREKVRDGLNPRYDLDLLGMRYLMGRDKDLGL